MTFEEFCMQLEELVQKHNRETQLRIRYDVNNEIISIHGQKTTPLTRARAGANDISELSFSTAEHHPYWYILYNCAQISTTILEKWDDNLTDQDLDEIKWSADHISDSTTKIKDLQSVKT